MCLLSPPTLFNQMFLQIKKSSKELNEQASGLWGAGMGQIANHLWSWGTGVRDQIANHLRGHGIGDNEK